MDDKIQKKLLGLFVQYAKNLPEKIQRIESFWQEQLSNWDPVTFQDFHREVHSLCGSAGTYGYVELGKAARQLEIYLKNIINIGSLQSHDKSEITAYVTQLNNFAKNESPANSFFWATGLIQSIENKIIYILEPDEKLEHQLRESLIKLGYRVTLITDMQMLQVKVKERTPVGIIINTDFLDKPGIKLILDLQKEQQSPILLFGIVPNDELLPRLNSIRAGCNNFLQKPIDVYFFTQLLDHKCSETPGEPYRILILDDSESLARYYALILNQAGMMARAIFDPMMLLKEINSFQPNLLLMDIYMPDCTGFELAEILRQEKSYTKMPIIFLSTEEDMDKKLLAISLGGEDFLTKPVLPQHLISAVKARSKRASVLNYYMTTDSLTGLLNHSSILKKLEYQVANAKQTNSHGSFVMIDIDHFKKVNDSFGHPIGDLVLKELANLLLSRLRSQDNVGRYGGEEFALILPGADLDDSFKLVNDLLKFFAHHRFHCGHQEFNVTFSAGIARFDGGEDIARLVDQADKALYRAKKMGRNQIITSNFTPKNKNIGT